MAFYHWISLWQTNYEPRWFCSHNSYETAFFLLQFFLKETHFNIFEIIWDLQKSSQNSTESPYFLQPLSPNVNILYNHRTFCCFCCLVAKSCPTLLWPTRLLCPWDFPGKNTGVGCHLLLQGIFLTQELNLHLLHWQAYSFPLSHLESP